jgi:hypothetical protein
LIWQANDWFKKTMQDTIQAKAILSYFNRRNNGDDMDFYYKNIFYYEIKISFFI